MERRGGRRKRQIALWHEGFYELMKMLGAKGFDQMVEFMLSNRPRRADMLLIRRTGADATGARVLRGLWPLLSDVTLLELKSPSRGFRRGDLLRLVSYGAQYHSEHWNNLAGGHALTLALVTPCMNQALRDELASMRWAVEPLHSGYAHIRGTMYTTVVAFTNEVTEAEDDDLLRIFSEQAIQTLEAHRWLDEFLLEKHTMSELTDREGYDELVQKLLDRLPPERLLRGIPVEERLRGLPPEERLRGLPPEERLRDLPPEETLLALPNEVLRGLPEDYIRTLPEHVQRAIRKRLA